MVLTNRIHTNWWLARQGAVGERKLPVLIPKCAVPGDAEAMTQPTRLRTPGAGVRTKQKMSPLWNGLPL